MTRPPGTARGVGRSLRVYYGSPDRAARLDRAYARFVSPGALVFDIGAHVGDRIASFRRLGARVLAVEPQPGPHRALRLIHGRDPQVTLLPVAVSDAPDRLMLSVNTANPTVSTTVTAFITAAARDDGWRQEVWDREVDVDAVTLDMLIAAHGAPAFIKIDVEGAEDRVLAGLSARVPALSFEVTMIHRDAARRSLDRLAALGPYRFALSLDESFDFATGWQCAAMTWEAIAALPDAANSGDVYARLDGA